uniref:Calcium-binding mitochondrial carrier protein SCaMC-2 n=1 Tax=Bursaphelenchus xylophilus TaxID=6326 RepID=A0A1I7SLT4_BURXY
MQSVHKNAGSPFYPDPSFLRTQENDEAWRKSTEGGPSSSSSSPKGSGPRTEGVPLDKINPLAAHQPQAPLIQGSVSKEAAVKTHVNLSGLSKEKECQIRELYDRLDMDNDGTINIRDLSLALQKEVPHIPSNLAPKILRTISKEDKDWINYSEFTQYVVEHERRLEKVFEELDRNKDGFIDEKEIKNYCHDYGMPLSDAKATHIVNQMDQTGSSSIDINEFKDYMLLYPSTDPLEIAKFWRHNLVIDIGEDSQIPEDFSPLELETGVWWRHLVAGGVAGCMSRTCTAPLDRLKVFLQVHSSKKNPYGVVGAIKYLHGEGGVKSFWRGNGINVVKIAPESAFKFMAYEQIKRLIQRWKGSEELSIQERFLAGSSAGAIAQSIIYPLEVLKTRLALRKSGQLDKGLISFAKHMYKTEGLICFYKGYIPNLLGIIPYAGIDLAIYETLKGHYLKHNQVSEPGVLALLACGTCSSTCGQLASYPLALIRTRLQARTLSNDKNQPDTMMGQVRYIMKNEGPAGLYRGITPNFMKVIPAVSISYVVYETVRKQLGAKMS